MSPSWSRRTRHWIRFIFFVFKLQPESFVSRSHIFSSFFNLKRKKLSVSQQDRINSIVNYYSTSITDFTADFTAGLAFEQKKIFIYPIQTNNEDSNQKTEGKQKTAVNEEKLEIRKRSHKWLDTKIRINSFLTKVNFRKQSRSTHRKLIMYYGLLPDFWHSWKTQTLLYALYAPILCTAQV